MGNWASAEPQDYSGTKYTRFRFKDENDLKSTNPYKKESIFIDGAVIESRIRAHVVKPYEFIGGVKLKGKAYVVVGLYDWDVALQSKIWNEKYEMNPNHVTHRGYHINFYHNKKKEWDPHRALEYFDKNCKYEFTIIEKDDPTIGWLSDHITDLEPFDITPINKVEEYFIKAEEEREKINREEIKRAQFQFPENETAYPEEDPNEVAKTEQIVGMGISQLTDCVNNTKTHALVQYVTHKFKENGLSLQDVKQCAFGMALYNNTQIVEMIVQNAAARYPERANEIPGIGTGKKGPLAIEGGPLAIEGGTYVIPDNVTFSEIVEVVNKTQTIKLVQRAARLNNTRIYNNEALAHVKRDSTEPAPDSKVSIYLDVLSDALVAINESGIITPEDRQLTPEQLKQQSQNYANMAQVINAFGNFKENEGYKKGTVDQMKIDSGIIKDQQIAMAQQNSTIGTLKNQTSTLRQQLKDTEKNMTTTIADYRQQIIDVNNTAYRQGYVDMMKQASEHLVVSANEQRKIAEDAKNKVEGDQKKFVRELEKEIRRRMKEQNKPMPMRMKDDELAQKALRMLKEEGQDVLEAVKLGINQNQSNKLITDISDFFMGESRDDLPDVTERKLDQQNQKLDSIYGQLYNITRQSLNSPSPEQLKQIQEFREEQKRMNDILLNLTKSTPTPTPIPTPIPTPRPTPTPAPTPDPYRKILEEILENQRKQQQPREEYKPPPQAREESKPPPRNEFGSPGYQFSHSSSNTSGSFSAPPPLKVYYPIKRNVSRFEGDRGGLQ